MYNKLTPEEEEIIAKTKREGEIFHKGREKKGALDSAKTIFYFIIIFCTIALLIKIVISALM